MRAWQHAKARALAIIAKEAITIHVTLMMSSTRCRSGILSGIICDGATAPRGDASNVNNWHWSEVDMLPWAKERLEQVCLGVEGKGVTVRTPLIDLTKAEIIRLGTELGVDYSLTVSCYDPSPEGKACGRCDSCTLRKRGFEQAGIPDPTRYA